jgi:hypothetical protein
MRLEARYLNGVVQEYEKALSEKDEAAVNESLDWVIKEKRRLSPCDRYDEEEILIYRIVSRGKNNKK